MEERIESAIEWDICDFVIVTEEEIETETITTTTYRVSGHTGNPCHVISQEYFEMQFLPIIYIEIENDDGPMELCRAPGTCCPEPGCDYTDFDYVTCPNCGMLCNECERKKEAKP